MNYFVKYYKKAFLSNSGFTLIELTVTTLLIPLLVITAGALFTSIYKQNEVGIMRLERFRRATFLIENIIKDVSKAYSSDITIRDIVNPESWAGKELVIGIAGSDDWARYYLNDEDNVLYYDKTVGGSLETTALMSDPDEFYFSYDDPDNPSAINVFLRLYAPEDELGRRSDTLIATAKWRNW